MSQKLPLIKTAINIAIVSAFPEAEVLQEAACGMLDLLADSYEDRYKKKNNGIVDKLQKVYEKSFTEEFLRKNGIDFNKAQYYKCQIFDILSYTEVTVSLLANCNNSTTELCNYLVSTYRDKCLKGVLEDESGIRRLLVQIIQKMVDIICSDLQFLSDGILELYSRMNKNEREIRELKEYLQYPRRMQEMPMFLSNPPFAPTEHFVGRETLIDKVLDEIKEDHNILLFSIGGLGKTEIAKKVVKRIADTPCNVYGIEQIVWIDYDNRDIRSSLVQGILATSQMQDLNMAWMNVQRIIAEAGKRLFLVVDNIESVKDENLLRLSQLPCKILITSRVKELADFSVINVEELAKEDCVTLFKMHYKKKIDRVSAINDIVDLTARHTVTIELLAKVANMEEGTLSQFLEKLQALGFKLSEEEIAATHEKLHKENKIIHQLAKLFSMVHLTKEETDLIVPISVIPTMPFSFADAKEWFKQKNHKNLEYLVRTGWLQDASKGGMKYYMIHSVIAAAIRFQHQKQLYVKCRDFVVTLTKEMQYPNDEHGASKKYLAQFCWSINDLLEEHWNDEKDGDFLLLLSRIYYDIANYNQALQILKCCVRIYKKNEGCIVKLISSYNQIGIVYKEQDKNKYALTQYAKAFKLAEKNLVEEELWITLLTDAALVFMETDGKKYGGFADCYFRRAYHLAMEVYGNGHFETRKIKLLWNHCIACYDSKSANHNFLDIIKEEEQIYPNNHIQLAETYSSYAIFLYEMGKYTEALVYIEKAYSIKELVLGDEHPEIMDLRNYRGLIWGYMGYYEKAKKEFEIYLELAKKIDGEESNTVATAYNNIGIFHFNTGDYETALHLFERAEQIQIKLQRLYGENYEEELATTFRNEGECYMELVDETKTGSFLYVDKAIDKFKAAGSILSRDVDQYKFEIAHIYGVLASAYVRKGWKRDAELSFQQAISDTINCKDEKHPSLAYLYNNYGIFLDDIGRKKEALEYLRKAEKILIYNGVASENKNLSIVRGAIQEIQKAIRCL